jgi:ParB family transcriptional regulator, chromosome partitioning protein
MLKGTESTKKRTALGLGLEALIPVDRTVETPGPASDRIVVSVAVENLTPNPYQPRRLFFEESLSDLSRSIKERGVIQPLIVRPLEGGRYEVVAGERRWRAAKMAGVVTVPVIVRNLSDSESLEIALIENLQRENLNPLDTAEAYDTLIQRFSYTHEDLAKRIGKDRSNITNHLRLLRLPDPIKQDLREDRISMGHARTLLGVEHLPTQLKLSHRIVKRKLSVRELERIVNNYKNKQQQASQGTRQRDHGLYSLETSLARHFSTRVSIKKNPDESGKLEIHFHSPEELARILETIGYSDDCA